MAGIIIGSFCLVAMIVSSALDVTRVYTISRLKEKTDELEKRLYKLEVKSERNT